MGGYAWVTLATNDAYSLGALVLAHSLRRVGTKYELAVLVTPGVTQTMREKLSAVFSVVMEVNVLDSKDEANLALLARPELGITFTKLHCWRLTQYDKCVFLDADTLVIRNCDELFEREELSAAPDVGWPDCFNSGVFVYKPSQQTFASITAFAAAKGSFDGGDQGLLNMYFSDWAHKDISKHLPFIYNMCSTATYSYLPAFKQFGDDVRIIHFIGITKPWLQYFDTLTGIVQPPMGSAHLQPLLQLWWNIFCDKVHPQLSPVMAGLAGALAQMTLGEPRSAEQIALEEHMRKQSWEQGQIDYMGRDSFDNIWKKICQTLSLAPARLPSPPKETQKPTDATEKTAESADPEAMESAACVGSVDEVDKGTAQATSSPEEQTLVNNVPITNNDNVESKLSEKSEEVINTLVETNETKETVSEETTKISQESLTRPESESNDAIESLSSTQPSIQTPEKVAEELDTSSLLEETTEKIVEQVSQQITPVAPSDEIQSCPVEEQKDELSCQKDSTIIVALTEELASSAIDITNVELAVEVQQTELDIRDEKHAKELSTASEILTTSPVPIQVAESVLQVEPKESVSDSQATTQEVLSSTITPVHESNVACSQTPTDTQSTVQMNGSASTIDHTQEKETLSSDVTQSAESIDTVNKSSESPSQLAEALQVEQPEPQESTLLPSITKNVETAETSIDTSLPQTTEQKEEQSEKVESDTRETKEPIESPLESEESQLPLSEGPVRPSRAKELNVPSESVPETPEPKSPEKVTKKLVSSKSTEKTPEEVVETTEGDSTGKKVVKKVVKKVTKKPKSKPEEALDEGVQDSSVSKQKKTVKVVKKGTKSLQASDTETTVSETPSSSTSDAPVPPKRKAKATATKSSVKKSDVE